MRHVLPYLILLLAAALLNVLVAWVCLLWSPYTSHAVPSDEPTDGGYPPMITGPYGESNWWFSAKGFGVWQAVPSGARGAEGHFLYWRGEHTPAYYRGGWPMRSLQSKVTFRDYRARWDLPAEEILRRGIQTSLLPAWVRAKEDRRLPLVPFWPGFAFNTFFYFLVLVALRFGWPRVSPPLVPRRSSQVPSPS